MELGDAAAWYAAVVSTLALGWEMFVHLNKGPKLDIRCYWERLDNVYGVVVDIRNLGDQPTTIKYLVVVQEEKEVRTTITSPKNFRLPKVLESMAQETITLSAPAKDLHEESPARVKIYHSASRKVMYVGVFHRRTAASRLK